MTKPIVTPMEFLSSSSRDETSPEHTPMKDFYRGKVVFLTGGTGFLGHIFVEKLLRINVKKIYFLSRPKKGKSPRERLLEMLTDPLFVRATKLDPHLDQRVEMIAGNTDELELGICDQDRQKLIEEVDIVLHVAADVRFNVPLSDIILSNVRGTREILELSTQMQKLLTFAYVSTAYSNCPNKIIEDRFYESPVDPFAMIRLAEKCALDANFKNQINSVSSRLIQPWPNTYVFSKALAEGLVAHYGQKIAAAVVRPSVVIATHEDPVPAWCNNVYGLNGMLVGAGYGILRVVTHDPNKMGDIICADFVVNSTLAVCWTTYLDNCSNDFKPTVYNVTNSSNNILTWGQIHKKMEEIFYISPSALAIWLHCASSTLCPVLEFVRTINYHVIPGIVMDMALTCMNKKLRIIPIYRKFQMFLDYGKCFTAGEWTFGRSNIEAVYDRMCVEDQNFFPADPRRFNWNEYSHKYAFGLRLYIAKDKLTEQKKAFKVLRKNQLKHYLLKTVYLLLVATFYYKVFVFFWDKY